MSTVRPSRNTRFRSAKKVRAARRGAHSLGARCLKFQLLLCARQFFHGEQRHVDVPPGCRLVPNEAPFLSFAARHRSEPVFVN